ncbi:MAG TPA: site-2 protease family protein [Solirubrobacteraceae bacterium]|jgi:Zn-dependent protease|nr:site-2 protease family protein [Solirubrobacteraceae bacterium]
MPVRRNFQLARVFGIRIGVGISWFVILGLILIYFADTLTPYFHEVLGGSRTTAYLVMVAIVLSFFASVIMHELGHALVARRNGVPVMGIELWALGGTTRTGPMPRAGVELRVAAAGPLVTLAVILISTALGAAVASSHHFFAVAVGSGGVLTTPLVLWLSWLVTLNVLVLILNLIPAFPLDGAQIVHALLWSRTGDRNRATRVVGRMGQGFGVLLGAGGIVLLLAYGTFSGMVMAFMGLFIYQSATAAVLQGTVNQRIQRLKVADVMDTEPVTIPAETGLLDAQEHFFGRYRWPWFAVVDPARHFLGVVRSERVDAEIAAGRPALPVSDVLEENLPIRIEQDQPLESLLRSEGLGRLGAMVAVDDDGVLRGVVTVAQIRQALRPAAGV